MRNIRKGFLIRREKDGIINAFSVEDLSEPLSDGLVQLNREPVIVQRANDLPDSTDFKPEREPEVGPEETNFKPEVTFARPGDELKNQAIFDPKRVSTTSTVYESIPDCDLEDPHLHIITEESTVPEFQNKVKPEDANPDQPMRSEHLTRPEVDHEEITTPEDVSDSTIDPLSTIDEEQNSLLTNPEDNLKNQKPEKVNLEGEKKQEEAENEDETKDDDDEGFFAKMKKHFVRRQSSSSSSSSSSKSSRSSSPSKPSQPTQATESTEPTHSNEQEPEINEFDERIDFNRIYINRNHKSHLKRECIKIVSSC